MRKLGLGTLTIVLCCCMILPAFGADATWGDDFSAAKTTANAMGKDILVEFTGSDWCNPCIQFKTEVLGTPDFVKSASADFELVTVDFPRSKSQPEAIKKQNAQLAQEFGIEGVPTVVLLDSRGRAYARTGYQGGGSQKFLQTLKDLREQKNVRDQKFTVADKSQGTDQARQLDGILTDLTEHGVCIGYGDVVERIIKLDANNAEGLKCKYEAAQQIRDAVATFTGGDTDGAIKKIDAMVKDLTPTGSTKQQVYYVRALFSQKKGDEAMAFADLKTAYEAAPQTAGGKQLKQVIDGWKGKRTSSDGRTN